MPRLVALIASLVLIVSLGGSAAAATPQNDIVKIVFVHYRDVPAVSGQAARTAACPDPATCTDNRWKGNYWPGGNVTYTLDTTGSGASGAATAIGLAFAAWTAPTGGGLHVTKVSGSALCSSAGGSMNEENQVCFRNLGSGGTIAVTYIWAYRSNKQIVEADTIFNTFYGWDYTNPGSCSTYDSCNTFGGVSGKMDIRNIATHEFGHFLALFSDMYTARDAQMTMYGYGDYAELQKDSLAKGDCLGITSAYGGSCP